mgnify:CR=1 FL=1
MQPNGTVLLADDEETFAKATQALLQAEGLHCDTVGDAHELASALEEHNYDLLITDLKMPGNRVMEMVHEIKSRSKILPVIVVTGYPSIASAVDSVRLNVLEYIVKPVEYPHLLECVRKGIQFTQKMRMVRSMNDLSPKRLKQLENVEHAIQNLEFFGATQTSESVTGSQNLAVLQAQLQEVVEHFKAQAETPPQSQPEVHSQAIVSDYLQLREAIFETIQVLQNTKGSFRSKELGGLRQRLQDLLKKTVPDC